MKPVEDELRKIEGIEFEVLENLDLIQEKKNDLEYAKDSHL